MISHQHSTTIFVKVRSRIPKCTITQIDRNTVTYLLTSYISRHSPQPNYYSRNSENLSSSYFTLLLPKLTLYYLLLLESLWKKMIIGSNHPILLSHQEKLHELTQASNTFFLNWLYYLSTSNLGRYHFRKNSISVTSVDQIRHLSVSLKYWWGMNRNYYFLQWHFNGKERKKGILLKKYVYQVLECYFGVEFNSFTFGWMKVEGEN